ncbi:MAG: hypothetical protein KC636_06050 [Myxococcales bacterium]|nr:hypothetical protein [Myxococcales bacterium]
MIGIRRAIALLLLSLFFWQFLLTALLGPDELFACFLALAICYGVAFLGVAAEWFWARWFAMGLGQFGSFMLLVLLQVGFDESVAFFGFSHLTVWLFLAGEGMAARYEHSEATAERWNFQEDSLALMRRAVRSAGMSLPFLILYVLGPKPELHQLLALGLASAGFVALVRGRTWSVFALGTAGAIALADGLGLFGAPAIGRMMLDPVGSLQLSGPIFPLLAGGLLIIPALFARPMLRFLRRA